MTPVPQTALLADLAHAEAQAHAPRTPERRAAAWLWVILTETRTIRGARLALAAIPDPAARADAGRLLAKLSQPDTATTATCSSGTARPIMPTCAPKDGRSSTARHWCAGFGSSQTSRSSMCAGGTRRARRAGALPGGTASTTPRSMTS